MNAKSFNEYEAAFNDKIQKFMNHPKYERLRKNADDCLDWHTGFGHRAIVAIDFMERIIAMPSAYIKDWLDGLNHLEWGENNIFATVIPKEGVKIELNPQQSMATVKALASRKSNNYYEPTQKIEVYMYIDGSLRHCTFVRRNKLCPNNTITYGSWH